MKKQLATSVSSFIVKGICALVVSYMVASSFAVEEFALWSVIFSLGMLLSVSDLGIGQYIVTTYLSSYKNKEEFEQEVITSLQLIFAIFIIISVGMLASKGLLLNQYELTAQLIMVVLFRLLIIPFGAYMQALGYYYERKLIEALGYCVLVFYVYVSIEGVAHYNIIMYSNVILTCSLLLVVFRAYMLGFPKRIFKLQLKRKYINVLKSSFPYFLNNSAGLLIYGGFIFILSVMLSSAVLAKVSLLHSIIFLNLYQCYELIFRTTQTKLTEKKFYINLGYFSLGSLVLFVVVFSLFGGEVIRNIFPLYSFNIADMFVFSLFCVSEVLFLLLLSRAQVDSTLSRAVAITALYKTVFFIIGFLLIKYLMMDTFIAVYVTLLVVSVMSTVFILSTMRLVYFK
jgi:hypothetical protein